MQCNNAHPQWLIDLPHRIEIRRPGHVPVKHTTLWTNMGPLYGIPKCNANLERQFQVAAEKHPTQIKKWVEHGQKNRASCSGLSTVKTTATMSASVPTLLNRISFTMLSRPPPQPDGRKFYMHHAGGDKVWFVCIPERRRRSLTRIGLTSSQDGCRRCQGNSGTP